MPVSFYGEVVLPQDRMQRSGVDKIKIARLQEVREIRRERRSAFYLIQQTFLPIGVVSKPICSLLVLATRFVALRYRVRNARTACDNYGRLSYDA